MISSKASDYEQQQTAYISQALDDIIQSQNTDNALPPCVPTRRRTWLDENGEAHTSSEFHVVDDNNNKNDGDGDHYVELNSSSSTGNTCPRRGEQSAMESSLDGGSRDMMPLKPLPKTSFSIMSEESNDSIATFGVDQETTSAVEAATLSDADSTAFPTSASIAAHHMAAW